MLVLKHMSSGQEAPDSKKRHKTIKHTTKTRWIYHDPLLVGNFILLLQFTQCFNNKTDK